MPHRTAKKKKKSYITTQNLQLDTTEKLLKPKTLLRITATLITSNVLYLGIQANLSIQNNLVISATSLKQALYPIKSGKPLIQHI